MKGYLTIDKKGIWMVKSSDLYSSTQGECWMFTPLSPESNSIKKIKDGEIVYLSLVENEEVDFEYKISGYDEINFTPINSAKLIFPEIEKFSNEQLIREYFDNGGESFITNEINKLNYPIYDTDK